MDEVPGAQAPLLPLHEQHALAGEDEEVLLLVLAVVEPVRLPRRQNVQPDAELRELGLPALKRALRAGRLLLAAFRGQPLGVAHVHDEPAIARGRESRAVVLEPRLGHRATLQVNSVGAWPDRSVGTYAIAGGGKT